MLENPASNEPETKKPVEYMEVNGVMVDVTDMSPEERQHTMEEANN